MKHGQAVPKRHRIFDHKLLGFLGAAGMYFLINLVFAFATYRFFPSSPDAKQILQSLEVVVSALLAMLWYHFIFRDEFDGVLGWSTVGMLLVLPGLLFVVDNFIGLEPSKFKEMNPVAVAFAMALAPGVCEEILFRGIPGTNWLRVRCEERDILPDILVTGAVFGLVHGMNFFAGAALGSTIFQVSYAFCLGVFFAAVMLRGGSIVPCMIMHTLIDFSAFLFMDIDSGGIITEELTIDFGFFITLVSAVILLAFGIYLVRPAKRAEIVALWNKKWHKEGQAQKSLGDDSDVNIQPVDV